MPDRTPIEWADATWNPIRGCSRVSPGCQKCYAERIAARFSHYGEAYEGLTHSTGAWNGKVAFVDRKLAEPLHWKRPRRIFVNSMGDLFHENVPDEWIDDIFAVMALCPQHTFQVLTKRAERMRNYCNDPETPTRIASVVDRIGQRDDDEELRPIEGFPGYLVSSLGHVYSDKRGQRRQLRPDAGDQGHLRVPLYREGGPLRGERHLVHRLVLQAFIGPPSTADTQGRHLDGNPLNNRAVNVRWGDQSANWQDRIRHGSFRSYHKLTEVDVVEIRRRLSAGESAYAIAPDFGVSDTQIRNIRDGKQWVTRPGVAWPLNNCWLGVSVEDQERADERIRVLVDTPACVRFLSCEPLLGPIDLRTINGKSLGWGVFIDWVIVGGESGPGARPMHPQWARFLRNQCVEAKVAFFFKQWGEWGPPTVENDAAPIPKKWTHVDDPAGLQHRAYVARFGKKNAGRLLDGRTWDEFPASKH